MAVKRQPAKLDSSDDNSPERKRTKAKAQNPKSPSKQRISYTTEDAVLMKKLKEEQHLPWNEIAKHFPGSSGTNLAVQYHRRLKGLCDSFTPAEMEQLKKLVAKQKKKFWAEIGAAMSRSGLGCEKAAKKAKLAMY